MSTPCAANGPGKSMFQQTCSLLRNYVKEKGPLPLPPLTQKPSTKDASSPMTIFYGGQVIVLNVPSSKAEEVMRLASKACSNVPTDATLAVPHLDSWGTPSIGTAASNDASRFQAASNDASRLQAARLLHHPIVADLSIKRKASLNLFLEKRKNRINARAPYNIKGEETSKSADERPWLELAVPSLNNS